MIDLLELAERVEKADGAEAELDALIYAETLGGGEWVGDVLRVVGVNLGAIDPGKHSRNFSRWYEPTPRYTASLDAAMSLVPDGLGWDVAVRDGRPDASVFGAGDFDRCWTVEAATPALALCAAALRARSAATS